MEEKLRSECTVLLLRPPAGIITQLIYPNPAINFDDREREKKHETKICLLEDQSHRGRAPLVSFLSDSSVHTMTNTQGDLRCWLLQQLLIWYKATSLEKRGGWSVAWTSLIFTYWVVIWDQASSSVAICAELNSWSTCSAPSMHAVPLLWKSPPPPLSSPLPRTPTPAPFAVVLSVVGRFFSRLINPAMFN